MGTVRRPGPRLCGGGATSPGGAGASGEPTWPANSFGNRRRPGGDQVPQGADVGGHALLDVVPAAFQRGHDVDGGVERRLACEDPFERPDHQAERPPVAQRRQAIALPLGFQALGQGQFLFAVQQRNRPHLPQIQPQCVVRGVGVLPLQGLGGLIQQRKLLVRLFRREVARLFLPGQAACARSSSASAGTAGTFPTTGGVAGLRGFSGVLLVRLIGTCPVLVGRPVPTVPAVGKQSAAGPGKVPTAGH